jgi:5'-nucleotidase
MMLHRRLLLAGLASLPMARIAHGAVAQRLTILHMNDLHSRHEPVDARALSCRADLARDGCFGGVARLATALAAERAAAEAQGRTVLLLDAGDQFQGSLFYTAWKGDVELAVMHAIGTEAMTVGNHEFDSGPANLARFAAAAKFPVLSANVDASAEPSLAGKLKPHVMIEKDSLKIGIVGLTTLEAVTGSSPGPLVKFNPPGPVLAASAAALKAQGAHLVIALSHLGIGIDYALAGNIANVDVFVGGHSHTLLSNSEHGALGPAHQALHGTAGTAVVVQAACFGRYFGRLDLDLDETGRPVAYGGDVRHVGLDLPEEPKVAAIIASYAGQLDLVRQRVIGQTAGPIDNAACRTGECPLGNFITDAMLASARGADLAILNAGGIRTGLPGGTITMGDVLTMLPFSNTVATVTLTGADVLAALANGVSRAGAGGFPQLGGARMTWDTTGRRVEAVELRQPDGSFARLDPARHYRVATNNFMRAGGDGYIVMRDRGIDPYDAGASMEDTVMAAFARGGTPGPTDGRIIGK